MATECAKTPDRPYETSMSQGPRNLRNALMAAIGFAVACIPGDPSPAREANDAIPTLDATTPIEPSDTLVGRYEGVAQVTTDGWEGTESFVVEDTSGVERCRWTWRTESTAEAESPAPCQTTRGEPCLFWHTVRFFDGADDTSSSDAGTDCTTYRDAATLLPDGEPVTYGFAQVMSGDTGSDDTTGYLLRYVWPEPPLPGLWLAFDEPAQWFKDELRYQIPVDLDVP